MSLVKLPDGQVVNKNSIETIRVADNDDPNGKFCVLLILKGQVYVSIPTRTKKAAEAMLQKVHEALGLT